MGKTIVIDARESGSSTGRYIDKLVEYLHRLEPEEKFTILTMPERVDFIKNIAPTFAAVPSPFREFTFGEQLGLKRQIDSLKPDLVHFGMVQQPILYHGKVVTTMHDLTTVRFRNPAKNPVIFTTKQQVYRWVIKKAAHKSAAIITPSEFVKNDIADFTGVSPDKITVTYESADPITETAEPLPELENQKFIMYVGRSLPHKNLPRLVEAFKELKVSHPGLKLVLAGKKDVLYESIARAVEQQGVEDVVFTGFVTEGQLRWLYQNCQAYIFPSLSEGFGLPGLEAMAHGAPVVSSNATCLPEIYGDAAMYFDPVDTSNMVAAISEVLDSPDLRNRLISAGKARVKDFSWQRMAEQTLQIYRSILNVK